MKGKLIYCIIAVLTFTGCNSSLEITKSGNTEIDATAISSENTVNNLGAMYELKHSSTNGNLLYDPNTENVYIKFELGGATVKSYSYFSVYYHSDGLPLHYCPHKDMFYTLSDNKVVEVVFDGGCPIDSCEGDNDKQAQSSEEGK